MEGIIQNFVNNEGISVPGFPMISIVCSIYHCLTRIEPIITTVKNIVSFNKVEYIELKKTLGYFTSLG